MRKGAKELLLFAFKFSRAVWGVGQLKDSKELQTIETGPEGSVSCAKRAEPSALRFTAVVILARTTSEMEAVRRLNK